MTQQTQKRSSFHLRSAVAEKSRPLSSNVGPLTHQMLLPTTTCEALARTGTFTVRVMPSADWLAIRQQQHQPLPWHESVLRPILKVSVAAWVYELDEESPVFAAARGILWRDRGKYAIDLKSEPILGHELLWNASGGARGSIVLTMPVSQFPSHEIFPHCEDAFVVGNSTVPHTPSAIRLARKTVSEGQTLCCLLSRTNGFEWISIYSSPSSLEQLLIEARSMVVKRAWYASSEA